MGQRDSQYIASCSRRCSCREVRQEQLQKFAERQRKTTSAECAYRYFETTRNLDVSELLPKVTVPTLVMHKRDDQVQPFEAGRELAAGIPGARFVALPGQNHIPLEQDPGNRAHARRDQTVVETVTKRCSSQSGGYLRDADAQLACAGQNVAHGPAGRPTASPRSCRDACWLPCARTPCRYRRRDRPCRSAIAVCAIPPRPRYPCVLRRRSRGFPRSSGCGR